MFKFALDQVVWYLYDSALCSAPVQSRMKCENLHDDWAHTAEQKKLWAHWGPSETYYVTCHGVFTEANVFASKQELVDSLVSA